MFLLWHLPDILPRRCVAHIMVMVTVRMRDRVVGAGLIILELVLLVLLKR